ncbi:MAG: calcium/sodium antiporter [Planctomycetes bacterium]|nr:calcium/sodium antiporter [Planctomycetota bacterium]
MKRILYGLILIPCAVLVVSGHAGLSLGEGVATAFVMLGASFVVLMFAADGLVGGAVGIADALGVPKLLVGIVLVSVATTAPEFVVSVSAALRGQPEFAVGNAVGSVICDDGLALGLMAILAPAPVILDPRILRPASTFLAMAIAVAFCTALDGRFTRQEGLALVGIFVLYITWTLICEARRRRGGGAAAEEEPLPGAVHEVQVLRKGTAVLAFILGVAGVLLSSTIVLDSAAAIAVAFGVPEVIIGLTLIAFGTSLPEIATCVAAARRGEGAIAAGDILGADILNICWILGMSAVANPIAVRREEVFFMFPAMIVVVSAMLLSMWTGRRLRRAEGVLLLSLFAAYLAATVILFGPPSTTG